MSSKCCPLGYNMDLLMLGLLGGGYLVEAIDHYETYPQNELM